MAHDTEEVWELAENRSIAVEERRENAGHSAVTVFVDDLDTLVDEIVARGIKPTKRETYDNGVRKVTVHDADGNEIGFGGGPDRVDGGSALGPRRPRWGLLAS